MRKAAILNEAAVSEDIRAIPRQSLESFNSMTIVSLEYRELYALYDGAIRKAILFETHALPIFLQAATDASNPDVRSLILMSVDRRRESIDRMGHLAARLGRGSARPGVATPHGAHGAEDWDVLARGRSTSSVVRDLSISLSGVGICRDLDSRYTTALTLSGILGPDVASDGLDQTRTETRNNEYALSTMVDRLTATLTGAAG